MRKGMVIAWLWMAGVLHACAQDVSLSLKMDTDSWLVAHQPILLVDYLSGSAFGPSLATPAMTEETMPSSILVVQPLRPKPVSLEPFRCGPYAVPDPLPLFILPDPEYSSFGNALFCSFIEGIAASFFDCGDTTTDIFGMFSKKKKSRKRK